jgi:hypothetical protein
MTLNGRVSAIEKSLAEEGVGECVGCQKNVYACIERYLDEPDSLYHLDEESKQYLTGWERPGWTPKDLRCRLCGAVPDKLVIIETFLMHVRGASRQFV